MAYERMVTIKLRDESTRDVYIHAGNDISSDVVDSFASRFRGDATLLLSISDYVLARCPFNERDYRIYQEDRFTFWVEQDKDR